jgi:hypothetical protein
MTLRIDLCTLTALVRAPLFEAPRLQEFWENYRKLPDQVRKLADKNLELLKSDPRHPSLRFKKIGRFWIGSHADYDKILGRSP